LGIEQVIKASQFVFITSEYNVLAQFKELGMLYYQTPQAVVIWDEEISTAVLQWRSLATGENYRTVYEKLLELIKEKNATRTLVDTRLLRKSNPQDSAWLTQDWMPRLLQTSITLNLVVIPTSEYAQKSVEEIIIKSGTETSADTIYFDDVDKARDWLKALAVAKLVNY
jgi:hypothetical protein